MQLTILYRVDDPSVIHLTDEEEVYEEMIASGKWHWHPSGMDISNRLKETSNEKLNDENASEARQQCSDGTRNNGVARGNIQRRKNANGSNENRRVHDK